MFKFAEKGRQNSECRMTNVEFRRNEVEFHWWSSSQWKAIIAKSLRFTMQSPFMSPVTIVLQTGLPKYDLLASAVPPYVPILIMPPLGSGPKPMGLGRLGQGGFQNQN